MKLLFFFLILIVCGCGNSTTTSFKTIESEKISNQKELPSDQKAQNSETDYQKLSFKTLNGFRIKKNKFASNHQAEDDSLIDLQVPKEIKDLDGKKIEISGYAFPLQLDSGKASSFVLMSILPSCCFGDVLKLNDMIYVDASKDLKEIKSQSFITIKGKLSIGMTNVDTWDSKFLYTFIAEEVAFVKQK